MRMARTLLILPLLALGLFASRRAEATVTVVFGDSWDGAANDLQHIVDARYGPGAIHVTTDYIGAHAGDPDPFGWKDVQFDALLVKEIAGNADNNTLGWYKETGSAPVIDGIDDGVVFDGPASAGASQLVVFPTPTPFGLYLNPNGPARRDQCPRARKVLHQSQVQRSRSRRVGCVARAVRRGRAGARVRSVERPPRAERVARGLRGPRQRRQPRPLLLDHGQRLQRPRPRDPRHRRDARGQHHVRAIEGALPLGAAGAPRGQMQRVTGPGIARSRARLSFGRPPSKIPISPRLDRRPDPRMAMNLLHPEPTHTLAAITLLSLVVPCVLASAAPAPPVAEKRPHPTTLHGDTRPDDYFWLRDKNDPRVLAYLEPENAYADSMTVRAQAAGRLALRRDSSPASADGSVGALSQGRVPLLHAHRGGPAVPVLVPAQGLDGRARGAPAWTCNALAVGHTFMAIGDFEVSPDGTRLAYDIDTTGLPPVRAAREATLRPGPLSTTTPSASRRSPGRRTASTLFYTQEDPVSKRSYRLYRHVAGHGRAHAPGRGEGRALRHRRGDDAQRRVAPADAIEPHHVRGARAPPRPARPPTGRCSRRACRPRVLRGSSRRPLLDPRQRPGKNYRLVTAPVAHPDASHWTEVIAAPPRRHDLGRDLLSGHVVLTERENGLPQIVVLDPATLAHAARALRRGRRTRSALRPTPSSTRPRSATATSRSSRRRRCTTSTWRRSRQRSSSAPRCRAAGTRRSTTSNACGQRLWTA